MDFVDEDVFINWAEKVSGKHVSQEVALKIRQRAGRFIAWLKKPDSDNNFEALPPSHQSELKKEEKQSGDDWLDIEYSHQVDGVKVETIKPLNDDENLGDINIDDI